MTGYYRIDMECNEARRVVALWESGAEFDDFEARKVYEHVASCPSCHVSCSAFLILFSGRCIREDSTPSPAARFLADRVMSEIEGEKSPSVRKGPRKIVGPLLAAGLAACVILVAGIGWRNATTVEVRFVLDAPGANSVFLAGTFSSWEPEGLPLRRRADGLWERRVRLRSGRMYTYNFVLDGTSWIADPGAPEQVDDGFGGESSLIRL